jgi:hypothetical protein
MYLQRVLLLVERAASQNSKGKHIIMKHYHRSVNLSHCGLHTCFNAKSFKKNTDLKMFNCTKNLMTLGKAFEKVKKTCSTLDKKKFHKIMARLLKGDSSLTGIEQLLHQNFT